MTCSSVSYYIGEIVRLDIGTVFLLAAILKSVDRYRNAGLVAASFGRYAVLATPLVVASEGTIGLALLLGLGLPFAALAACALAGGFAAISLTSRLSETSSGCRCFGAVDGATPRWFTQGRAVLLLGACAALSALAFVGCASVARGTPPEVFLASALSLVVLGTVHAAALRIAAFLPHVALLRTQRGTE